mgnify:CR=1 FL=1
MKLGIIGGSGLDDPKLLSDYKEIEVETAYGKPSSSVICGKLKEVEVCIISRHGKGHTITPTNVNNRANMAAFAKLGCKYVIATSAVGSLKEEIKPGDFVIPDQLIDFTKKRENTFYDNFEQGVVHASLANPFSEELREKIISCCDELGYRVHSIGTTITIEGPRFSTRAESNLFRNWGADVVGMTTAPEASLAKEAGLEYAVIAMSTDYDCWKEGEENVSIEMVFSRMKDNAERVKKLLIKVIEKFNEENKFKENAEFIKSKIRTVPNFPKQGIMFRDITTLLRDYSGLKKVIDLFEARYKDKEVDLVAGIESRGFLVASVLADRLKKGLVLVRKPGKLPAETLKQEYDLEYGKDAIEIHKDAISSGQKVLLCDDLLATGGTSSAAANLIEKLGGEVVEVAFIVELPELKGREKLKNWNVFNLVSFEGK